MATKQKYEVVFNKKRNRYEVLKAGFIILSSPTEESALNYVAHCKNSPFIGNGSER